MHDKLRILVVDDDGEVRERLQLWLTHLGHEVFATGSRVAFPEACRAGEPDLIISDAHLPDLDDMRSLETARRQAATPAILLSSGWDNGSLRRAAGLGQVWCLAKPVRPLELVAVIAAVRAAECDRSGR